MKNILFVASEGVPFIKTGGLADVVGSLPKCIDREYFDVRVILPKYTCMTQKMKDKLTYKTHFYMDFHWKEEYVGIMESEVDGIKYYMVQNNKILGEDSTLKTIYQPLYLLDKNNDKKITSAELKNGNIRFVRLNNSGQLELNNKSLDYPLANISYIDLNTLRRTQNAGDIGSFGYFDIYINHNYQIKKFIGQITYENKEDINRLMGR